MSKRNKAFSIFMAFAFSSIILGAAAASSSVCWLKKKKEASGDFITLSSHNDFFYQPDCFHSGPCRPQNGGITMRAKQIIDRNFLWFVVPSCIMLVVSFFMGTLGVNLLLTPITDSPSANTVSLFAKLGGAAFLLGGMGIGFYSFLIFLMSFITKLAYKNTKGRVTAYRVLTCITCAIAIFPFCSLFEFLLEIAAVGIPYLVVTVVACIVNLKGAFSKELEYEERLPALPPEDSEGH